MASLADTATQRFHRDMRAAILSREPIVLFPESHRRAESQLAKLKELEKTTEEQLADANDPAFARYLAARKTFETTQSTLPVLDGLTVETDAKNEITKVARRLIWYVFAILVLGVISLFLYWRYLLPIIYQLQEDFYRDERLAEMMVGRQIWVAIAVVFGTVLVVAILSILFLGPLRLGLWLGGQRYVDSQVFVTTIRIIHFLQAAGVESPQQVCFDLLRPNSFVRDNAQRVLANSRAKSGSLLTIGDYWQSASRSRLKRFRVVAPLVLVATVGGIFMLAFGLLIFQPIVELLRSIEAGVEAV